MTRTITISTSEFAAIWANRRDGEETEDAILGRLLGCDDGVQTNRDDDNDGGVYDSRYDMHFPEGFELFQNYKRGESKAIARSGVWIREDTKCGFPPLTDSTSRLPWATRMSGMGTGDIERPRGRSGPLIRCVAKIRS